MINRFFFMGTFLVFLSATDAKADRSADILRGGFGFLFGDTNGLYNPGQMALTKGFTGQGALQTTLSTPKAVAAIPSLVYANGKYALAAHASRVGTSLTMAGEFSTTGGVMAGIASSDKVITAGAGYSTGIENASSSVGVAQAFLTWNGTKNRGKGAAVGFGGSMTLGGPVTVKTLTFGAGYSFRKNASFEVNVLSNNLEDLADWTLSGHATWSSKKVYVGLGGQLNKTTSEMTGMGRLGVLIDRADVSAYSSINTTTSTIVVGGTIRMSF